MLPYQAQVVELQKLDRYEPAPRNPMRRTPSLLPSRRGDDVSCLVCGAAPSQVCGACHSVHYCDKHHQELDARWHDVVCDALSEVREDQAFRETFPVQDVAQQWLGRGAKISAREVLEGWDAYLGTSSFKRAEHRRVLTDLASRPLTVARLLAELDVKFAPTLRVHIMGASAKELESLSLYQELATLWPESEFEVALIGPELPIVSLTPPPRVRFSLHVGEYRRALWAEIGQPHLIVGFNAGLLLYRTWGNTLPELFGSGVTFVITSYRSWEARAEAALLGRMGAVPIRPPKPNPFASRASRRSSTVANDVSRDNSYLSMWR